MTYNPVKICNIYYVTNIDSNYVTNIDSNYDADGYYYMNVYSDIIQRVYDSTMYVKGIPKFAKGYEKEYRYIRGINKLFLYLVNKLEKIKENNIDYYDFDRSENYECYTSIRLKNLVKNDIFYKEFFESKSFNNIIKIIKRFLKYQELNKIKDISNLIFPRFYLDNIRYINNFFCFYKLAYVEKYFGFEEIYNLFKKFFNKLKYGNNEDDIKCNNNIVSTFYFVYDKVKYPYFFYNLGLILENNSIGYYKNLYKYK